MLSRQWMYNRNLPGRKGLTDEFIAGVDEFIQFAINQDDSYKNGENIRCPCFKCKNTRFVHPNDVVTHLYRRGFKQCYWNWTCHGEELFPTSEEQHDVQDRVVEQVAEIGSSSTVIYRGGSVSSAVHRLRLEEELGREPTPKECFIRTHGKKDGTLEAGRATEIVEQFDKAIVDKCSQGVDEASINQDELWDEIAIGSRNRVVGKGNIVRKMSSSNYKPRAGPSESTEQLRNKVKELQDELARSRADADAELARRELFESSLLAALRVQGIDLSSMPTIARTPHGPRAPTGESQTHADEHSPMLKRVRASPSTDNSHCNFDDDVGRD